MEDNDKLFLFMDSVISSTKPQIHSLFQVVFLITLLLDIPIQIYLHRSIHISTYLWLVTSEDYVSNLVINFN